MSSISLFLDRLLTLVRLAFRSAGNRRTNFWLTLLSIALSTSCCWPCSADSRPSTTASPVPFPVRI